jgi:fluoride exporter
MLFLASITLAGGLGTLARYGISNQFHGDALPWATLAINVLGSFLLGALVVLPSAWLSVQSRDALGVGLLGGFTTFSTFSVQALLDLEAGEPGRALLYVGASVVLGVGAAAAGYFATRALVHIVT